MFDQASQMCRNKGDGWHLHSNAYPVILSMNKTETRLCFVAGQVLISEGRTKPAKAEESE